MKLTVLKHDGSTSGSVEFPDNIFSTPVNNTILWEAVEAYRANMRQGTAKTKTRSEVEGAKKKLFPQKHLGRARMGTLRSPVRVHGGVAHGPQPRSYRKNLSQALRKKALLEALKQKIQNGDLSIIEDITVSEPKTKLVAQVLAAVRQKNNISMLLVPSSPTTELLLASRNIAALDVLSEKDLNAYAVWRPKKLMLFKSACDSLIARWK
jgi:large subunit ribosomal protein L4